MTKRKEQRRELLKEDEFLNFVERAIKYGQEHAKTVLYAGFAVVVALIAIFGFAQWWERHQNQNAAELYQAERILDTDPEDANAALSFDSEREKYQAALKALDEVIAEQSGAVRDQALVRKIAVLINLGRQSEIEPVYRELAQSNGEFACLGEIGLGDYYASRDEFDAALEHFNGALSKDAGLLYQDLIHFKMAKCYKDKGDYSTARVELDALLAKFEAQPRDQRSPLYDKVKGLHEELDAQSPVQEKPEAS